MFDSETTGFTPPVQFVEIAIVDASAKVLFEGTVRPVCRIESSATRIHGHSVRSLAGSPRFLEAYPYLLEALWGKRVIVYNASYDRRVWDAEVRSLGARGALVGELPPWECAMRRYAAYVGEPSKRGGYRSQKLTGGPQRPGRCPGDAAADRGDGRRRLKPPPKPPSKVFKAVELLLTAPGPVSFAGAQNGFEHHPSWCP